MKKIISFLFGILLVISCSTSSDNNGNSTTTVVPVPPTNLIGAAASTTQINLSWTDSSTNETGFKIERRTGSVSYIVVGTLNQDVLTFSDSGLTPSTTYIYRVYSYNSVGNSPTYSNEVSVTTTDVTALPALTSTAASLITQTTATSGGNVSDDGGAPIIERGVCWSISQNPTIALTTRTTDGTGTGTFTSNISGLIANTTYYVRAYATNSAGTAYGTEINFATLVPLYTAGPNVLDVDGNIYQSVTNCGLTYTKQNLNVSKYSDGTPIPQVTDTNAWASLTTGAWCYYENNTANGPIYGKLYNWYAVMGIYDAASAANPALRKKLAPTGWHIPSDAEWTQSTDCLGGESVAGGKMKSTGTIESSNGLWHQPNYGATNASGFTGLPGGSRGGTFDSIDGYGYWWSSSEFIVDLRTARTHKLYYFMGEATGSMNGGRWLSKYCGLSVRLLRD